MDFHERHRERMREKSYLILIEFGENKSKYHKFGQFQMNYIFTEYISSPSPPQLYMYLNKEKKKDE